MPLATPLVTRKELRQRWILDLLTTKAKQGKGFLNRRSQYCCLGRACEIAIRAGVEISKSKDDAGYVKYGYDNRLLPPAVVRALGIRTAWGAINNEDDSLTRRNDDGATFPQIARIIQHNASMLFTD